MTATRPGQLTLVAGVFAATVAAAPRAPGLVLVIGIGAAVAAVRLFPRQARITAAVIGLACAAGTARGLVASAVDHGPGSPAGHLQAGATVLRGTVAQSGVPGRDDTIVVDVSEVATAGGLWRVAGAVVAQPRTPTATLPGDAVEVQTAGLRAPPVRPGALSISALERVGATAIAPAAQVTLLSTAGPSVPRAAQQLRRALSSAVARWLPEPEATLLLGIVFGVHGSLTGPVRAALQNAGLIHIVAVSGLKVVMVAGMVQAVGRARSWSPAHRRALTLLVIALYVVLSGAGAAALRSSLTVGAGLLLNRDGRSADSFALLSVAAATLLGIDPVLAGDVGFQLSFLGTAGILVLASPIATRLPGPRLLVEPFAVTVAAQLATAPVTAGSFGVISLVGPFANALILPLLPLAIVSGGCGALLAALLPMAGPALGWVPLQVAALVARVVLAVATGAAALPFAALQVQLWPAVWTLAEVAGAIAGALTWQRRRVARGSAGALPAAAAALVATAAVVAVAGVTVRAPLRITVLDVGNGAAVLIRPAGGGTVLVDGGADGPALLTALGRVLSPLDRHLDAVVLTATDRASSAALGSLVGHYDVGRLLVSQPLPAALQSVAGSLAGAGTAVTDVGGGGWTIGSVRGRCVPAVPVPSAPCVLLLQQGRGSALITGNLAQAAQDELAGVQAFRLQAQLLVAPVTTAPSQALLGAVRPSLIAVPARRQPPGLNGVAAELAVTGRDSDLEYDAEEGGGLALAAG